MENIKKTILITGGAGYIGSHLLQVLLKKNYRLVVVDNLSTGFKEALPENVVFYQVDLLNKDELLKVFSREKVDIVIHLAAKLNVKESVLNPGLYYENNVTGLMNLLSCMLVYNVKNIIFSSSATVYGDEVQDRALQETDTSNPISPYGRSKLMCERILDDYRKSYEFHYTILRYFNVAGAADDLSNGQRTLNSYHLIHLAAQAALGLQPEVKIFGTDYPTADGMAVRDYIHVQDLADLHALILEHPHCVAHSEIFNCGYGQGYSVKEILLAFQKATNTNFSIVNSMRRPGDTAIQVCDSTKIQKILNWVPKRNNLTQICLSAYEWEKKYQEIFNFQPDHKLN